MCEASSPPQVGSVAYILLPADRPPPPVGSEFTEPWGAFNVTYRVEGDRGPAALTGRPRLDCVVMDVRENGPGT